MPKTIEIDTIPVMFTKGQAVSCTVCKDETSSIVAEAVYNTLNFAKENGELIPFADFVYGGMSIQVTDVAVSHKKDPIKGAMFTVVMEGVLV